MSTKNGSLVGLNFYKIMSKKMNKWINYIKESKLINKKNILHELYYVLILGSVPALLSYIIGGTDELLKLMNSSTPPFILLLYLSLIFGLHLVITLELKKKPNSWWEEYKNSKRLKVKIFISNLAQGVIGIYRLITGIALIIPLLSYFFIAVKFDLIDLLALESIGISFFMGTCLISFIYKWTETIPKTANSKLD